MPQKKTANKKTNQLKNDSKLKFKGWWGYLIIFFIIILFYLYTPNSSSMKEIDNVEFKEMFVKREISKIEYVERDKQINIFLKEDVIKRYPKYEKYKNNTKGPQFYMKIAEYHSFNDNLAQYKNEVVEEALSKDNTLVKQNLYNQYDIPIINDTSQGWGNMLFWIFPILIFLFLIISMRTSIKGGGIGGGGGIFNIGKSKAQLFDDKKQQNVSFKDVAGLEGAKYEVEEIVDFLKTPKKYTELGGKIPKGALLVGPPGTGKTLLAKAVAGEAKVPFFSLSGSDFVEMFVGVGASRVRDLFKTAKEKAPCIVFIDEIDAIGRARGKNLMNSGANDERENTLNQLLTEMDGFSSNNGVIILAATNRADILDRALLRAGRFDRQIHIELPNLNERKGIFEVHIRNLKLSEDVDLDFFAKQTPGFSGADIANVCNEAALIAARNGKKKIEKEDFLSAIDRIIGGLEKKGSIISPQEKRTIAYHEAGHAAVSWLLPHASPLVKVTIVPRGRSLGAAWYLPEERNITTTEQLFDEMTATMGGRASEEIMFGKISTGALSDLEKVTKQAYAMITYYGLNKKIGNISYYDSTGQQEYSFSKPYSEETAREIDIELRSLTNEAYQRAKQILTENKDKLQDLAKLLLEKEVIFSEDLENIFGKREELIDNNQL